MISIAVVDDDASDASVTESFVARYFHDDDAGYTLHYFPDGNALLRDYRAEFDVIFLDVEMPGIDGLETARRLREIDEQTVLIFTTKMAQYAAAGYDVDAIGYLLKPLNYYAFDIKMRKAQGIVGRRRSVTVPLTVGAGTQFLPSSDIRYVEVLDHTLIYHAGERQYRTWSSLKAAASVLEPAGFIIANRYCLINPEWVRAVDGDVVDVDGENIRISRSRRKTLMQALVEYHGG